MNADFACKENEKILFIDDDKAIARMMNKILEKFGCEAEIHTNPNEALDSFKANSKSFDLVITDLTFEGYDIDGVELIKKIKEIRNNIKIILLTGNSENLTQEEGVKILEKPIERKELAKAIREALGKELEAVG